MKNIIWELTPDDLKKLAYDFDNGIIEMEIQLDDKTNIILIRK